MKINNIRFRVGVSRHIFKRMAFFIWCILYRLCLDIGYSKIVAEYFEYFGFVVAPTFLLKLYSWIIFSVFTALTYKCYQNKERLSDEIVFVLFLLSVVPTTTMIGYGQYPVGFIVCISIYWLAFFLVHHLFVLGNMRFVSRGKNKPYYEYVLMLIFLLLVSVIIYISGRYTHFRLHFNLLTVYELRNEAAGYNLPAILRYLYGWSRVAIPVFIIYFFCRNKKILGWACFFIQMLNFAIDGSKTVFFLALFAVIIAHLPKMKLAFLNWFILRGMTCLYTLCILIYKFAGNVVPISLFMRRILFVPAYLEWAYYDFFLDKTPDFFRASFLRHLGLQTPYPNLVNMIGGIYGNSYETNANNGLFSDAITNWGHIGILIMPFFLCLVLCMLDDSSKKLDSRVYILSALYLSIVLTNTFLMTVLLTHGLLIVMIILFLMKRETPIKKKFHTNKRSFDRILER